MKALRLTSMGVCALVISLYFGQSLALAQPPGTIAAGEYTNTSNQAGFFTFGGSANFDLFVIDASGVAAPKGAPRTTSHSTRVFIDAFGPTVFGNGCYEVSAGDFSFGSGTASLHTMITNLNGTCGGPPATLPLPFTIDASWTGNAPVTSGRSQNNFDCGSYGLQEMLTNQFQGAAATVAVSPLFADTFSAPQDQLLRTDKETIHAEGVQPDGCQPAPGIPGGAGPPPAGDYSNKLVLATASSYDPTTGQFAFFTVTDSAQVSTPRGGSTTNTNQFQVNFNINANGTFAFGCYELTPADFTDNGVSSATLSLNIDQNTPVCPFAQPNLSLPQTLAITWSGVAPVAPERSTGNFTCLSYHLETTGLTTTSRASSTATLSPMFGAPFTTPDQAALETSSSTQRAEGAQQPVCHL